VKTAVLEFVRLKLTNYAIGDLSDELKVWQKLLTILSTDPQYSSLSDELKIWQKLLLERLKARLKNCPDAQFLAFFSRGDSQDFGTGIEQIIGENGIFFLIYFFCRRD